MTERSPHDRRRVTRETPERRRRGRPALSEGDPSTNVCVKMPGTLYDEAFALASEQRLSVPEMIRRAVRHAIAGRRSA